jgi:hypothetical protein
MIFSVKKIKGHKKGKAVEKASEILAEDIGSNKNFNEDAKNLFKWLGINSGHWWMPNVLTQTFNGDDELIVKLLSQYNKSEFTAVSGIYKELYNRVLLDDLDTGISPLEFDKIKNIFY